MQIRFSLYRFAFHVKVSISVFVFDNVFVNQHFYPLLSTLFDVSDPGIRSFDGLFITTNEISDNLFGLSEFAANVPFDGR